jgi:hypothetical protein
MACGVWRVACGVWRVACGVWRVSRELCCALCGRREVYLCCWLWVRLILGCNCSSGYNRGRGFGFEQSGRSVLDLAENAGLWAGSSQRNVPFVRRERVNAGCSQLRRNVMYQTKGSERQSEFCDGQVAHRTTWHLLGACLLLLKTKVMRGSILQSGAALKAVNKNTSVLIGVEMFVGGNGLKKSVQEQIAHVALLAFLGEMDDAVGEQRFCGNNDALMANGRNRGEQVFEHVIGNFFGCGQGERFDAHKPLEQIKCSGEGVWVAQLVKRRQEKGEDGLQLGAVVWSIWGENAQNIGGDTRYKKSDIKRCAFLKYTFAKNLGNGLELVNIFTLRERSHRCKYILQALADSSVGSTSACRIGVGFTHASVV